MAHLIRIYSSALKRFPTSIQSLQAGTLMGAGDAISQFLVERKTSQEYEWQRTVRFFSMGVFMIGPVMKTWYGMLDKMFGSTTKAGAMKKVLLDQGLFAPTFIVVFLGTNYTLQGKLFADTRDLIKKDYFDILVSNYTVWPAVQICNFSIVPLRHQVLFVQIFALFWNTYLAWKTNSATKSQENIG